MDGTQQARPRARSRARSLARCAGLAAAALLAVVPIAQLLVWSWELHPLLVLPAYVLGIPLWLTALSLAWSGVQRVRATTRRRPARAGAPAATATLLVPAPRQEGAVPLSVRTPTP